LFHDQHRPASAGGRKAPLAKSAPLKTKGAAPKEIPYVEPIHQGKSRSLTGIREKRDWVRDDNVGLGRRLGGGTDENPHA
jgi:hypothetical protein